VVVCWVTEQTPRAFGWLRSRRTCAVVAGVLLEVFAVSVSRETVRRWLRAAELVWRRPRPARRPKDPRRPAKLQALRRLLADLPADETAVFEDEVDRNTNPTIGGRWMRQGQQARVETPGTNPKRYLAGSVDGRTGPLVLTEGGQRDAALLVRHLDDLRCRLRCYRVIHVIGDNARFHVAPRCRKVQAYLRRWGHRVKLHYLPTLQLGHRQTRRHRRHSSPSDTSRPCCDQPTLVAGGWCRGWLQQLRHSRRAAP
jgi:putative transposase